LRRIVWDGRSKSALCKFHNRSNTGYREQQDYLKIDLASPSRETKQWAPASSRPQSEDDFWHEKQKDHAGRGDLKHYTPSKMRVLISPLSDAKRGDQD
jgi:hypothetical protein